MHKRLYLVSLVLIISTLALGACGGSPPVQYVESAPQNRVAFYTTTSITLDDTYPNLDDYRDYYGKWQIQFEDGQHFSAILNRQEVVGGEYRLSENEFQVFDMTGPFACLPENNKVPGHYAWFASNTELNLALIEDKCTWRSLVFTKHPLVIELE